MCSNLILYTNDYNNVHEFSPLMEKSLVRSERQVENINNKVVSLSNYLIKLLDDLVVNNLIC